MPDSSVVCMTTSGTINDPITIQAAPGHVGKVVINGENKRLGIHMQFKDYIHIKYLRIINASHIAIANWDVNSHFVSSLMSDGVVIEGNSIENVSKITFLQANGKIKKVSNTSGIGAWNSRKWIIRNNRIKNIGIYEGASFGYGV